LEQRLSLEAAEKCSGFTCPETLHVPEAGISQPFHLVFQRRTLAVEIDEAAAAFNERKYIGVDALDDFGTAGIVKAMAETTASKGPISFCVQPGLQKSQKT
jgi:hypothetical protein